MREILFRGKRVDNGEYMPGSYGDWVYGSYGLKLNVVTGEHDEYIMESVYNGATNSSYFVDYKIIPGTAGQYTGMTDRNGNKIFEGDDFKDDDDNGAILHCVFKDGAFCVEIQAAKGALMEHGYDEYAENYEVIECENISYYDGYLRIIGNIHDGA